jgi:hypothetical protein
MRLIIATLALALGVLPALAQQPQDISPKAAAETAQPKAHKAAAHRKPANRRQVQAEVVRKHPSLKHLVHMASTGDVVVAQKKDAAPAPSPAAAPAPRLAPAANAKKPIPKATAEANPVVVLQQFTVDDLQAALTDALAQTPPDTIASDCYAALIPIVQTGVGNPLPTGLGGFQLLQKARDLKSAAANLQSANGPLAGLNKACAPLVMDVNLTLIQLGIVGGGVLATGGVALPVTLPGILGLFSGLPQL